MKLAAALAGLLLGATAARAQPMSGFYVQGSTGLALPQQQTVSLPPSANPAAQSPLPGTANTTGNSDSAPTESGSLGWGLGNGLRMEIEGLHTGSGPGTAN